MFIYVNTEELLIQSVFDINSLLDLKAVPLIIYFPEVLRPDYSAAF